MPFAVYLRARRREARVSQAAAAAYVGVHRVTWQNWELGKARPDGTLLLAVCNVLGVEPRALLQVLDGERRATQARGEPTRGRRKRTTP